MHDAVARERWIEPEGLPGIRADSLRTPANHIAVFRQERHQIGVWTRYVRAILLDIQERGSVLPFGPVGTHKHPGAGLNASVFSFPRLDMLWCKEEIRIAGHLSRHVNRTSRRKKFFDGDRIRGVVQVVSASNPMNGRIKMRACVLT